MKTDLLTPYLVFWLLNSYRATNVLMISCYFVFILSAENLSELLHKRRSLTLWFAQSTLSVDSAFHIASGLRVGAPCNVITSRIRWIYAMNSHARIQDLLNLEHSPCV